MKTFCTHAVLAAMLSVLFLVSTSVAQDFSLRGRLHMDALVGVSDADDFSNGFNNRRARLGANGKLTDKWDGRIEIDFADNSLDAKDFRLRRSFDHGGRLWLGQYKVPQGLNELTSSNEITFIERASANNIIPPSRRIGIGYEYFRGDLGFKTMLFGRELGQRGAIEGDMPLGLAFRGFFSPEFAGGVLHIGASVAYEDLMDNNTVRYRDRPEARDSKGGSVRLIDTGTITEVESTLKLGGELAFVRGPLSLEAEYLMATVNRENGDEPTFSGGHVQVSYVLGGARRYSSGDVRGVRPADETGAWELAARFSHMNLNDAGFTGGEQNNITLGLNRYVTRNLRFMSNIVIINVDKIDETPVVLNLRAQYHF
ncbi:MAG: porin [Balneolaceae bacterium]|nr:MAG: porin [Balneolaceae bacterium]